MQQGGKAHHVDREVEREIRAPDHDARQQQADHADQQHEEQDLLAGIVFADLRKLFLTVVEHVIHLLEPLLVAVLELVVVPEAQHQDRERDKHHQAGKRMQDARPLPAAEQVRQPRHRGMEHGQAGQGQHDESDRGDPVIRALVRVVAFDQGVAILVAQLAIVMFTMLHAVPPGCAWPLPRLRALRPCSLRSDRHACNGTGLPAPWQPCRPLPAAWTSPSRSPPSG